MADEERPFLTLRFDGGRFKEHTIPVAVLNELVVIQDLLEEVARHLLLSSTERKRVPAGFSTAAQLHLSSTEHNCFTVQVVRLRAGVWDDASLFDRAVESSLRAFEEAGAGLPFPDNFPPKLQRKLATIGRRLNDDETLCLGSDKLGKTATVNQETRRRIASLAHVDDVALVDIVGEVCVLDDSVGRFTIRKQDGSRVDVKLKPEHRADVADALSDRPAYLVSVQGWLTAGKPMEEVQSLAIVTHDRTEDINKLRARFDFIAESAIDGWDGERGAAASQECLAWARSILTRLVADYPKLPRPRVFPTTDGFVQAEWSLDSYAIDLLFSTKDRVIHGCASSVQKNDDREQRFGERQVSGEDASPVYSWLRTFVGGLAL